MNELFPIPNPAQAEGLPVLKERHDMRTSPLCASAFPSEKSDASHRPSDIVLRRSAAVLRTKPLKGALSRKALPRCPRTSSLDGTKIN